MNVVSMYRQTLGIFREAQRIYPLMAFINIVVSVVLVKRIGVAGVPLGTAIARLTTTFWFEGLLVFRRLERSFTAYLREQAGFAVLAAVVCAVAYWLCASIPLKGIAALPVKAILTAVLAAVFSWIAFGRSPEWQWGKAFVKERLAARKPRG